MSGALTAAATQRHPRGFLPVGRSKHGTHKRARAQKRVTSLLLIVYWLELWCMAVSNYKGGWKVWCSCVPRKQKRTQASCHRWRLLILE